MITYSGTYYNTTNGLITSGFDNLPFLPAAITEPSTTFIDRVYYDPIEYYIDVNTGDPILKVVLPITQDVTTIVANGVDTVTFSGIPVNTTCEVIQIGQPPLSIIVDDGSLTLTYDKSGDYTVDFSNSYYLPLTLGVTAT